MRVIDKELVRYHIYPDHEKEPEHDQNPKCWCDPYLDAEEEDDKMKIEVWVHNRTQ